MIVKQRIEHRAFIRSPQLPSELERCRRRERHKSGRLPLTARRWLQHVRLCDQQAQPRRKARAVRVGDVQLPNVLRGDVRVGAHVDNVDTANVLHPL